MSEIKVTVVGSTDQPPIVTSGDVINVTFADQSGRSGSSAAATIQVGTVETIDATQTASVVNSGTAYAAKLDFSLPRGLTGPQGAPGPVTAIKIGTVVTGAEAAATLTGTGTTQATLSLVLPQGATGQQGVQGEVGPTGPANSLSVGSVSTGATAAVTITGNAPSQQISFVLPQGPQGITGDPGPYTTIQVGTVTTGAAGSAAKIDTVTSGSTVTLNFTVPRGYDGTSNLGDEIPQPLGTASAGSATVAARADHVHDVPVIAYSSLSGVPSTFPAAAHTHTISQVQNLQAALDAKQAAGNYPTLDGSGKISSSFLPSYVDDVVEAAQYSALPGAGESGKLYVTVDNRKLYRWSGSTYVEIAASPGSTDSVPEGSVNKYFTVQRAADAAPVQSVNGKTGAVTIEAGGIAWSSTPTSTTTITAAGNLSYDENYLYVANAVNQWRRAAIDDWTTPTITISVQPGDQTAVSGTATFAVTASATQNAELTYQWQRQAGGIGGWVNIATGLSATLDLADLSYAANNGDKYRVVISSGAAGTGGTAVNGWLPAVVVELTPTATLTSNSATLTVSAAISIITQPQAVTLTSGTSASFSISATTPGTGLSYQWQSSPDGTNWTNISGATASTLGLTGLTETGNSGLRYRCVVSSSGYDDATSNAALLTVAPITVTSQPASQTGAPVAGTTPNYSATFSAAATSPAGAPTLQWEVSTDGGTTYSDVSGQTNSSLSLTGLTNSDTGKRYRAKFEKSGWNTVRSNAATLTVPTDVITVTSQPSNTTASVSSYSATAYTLPSGTWESIGVANGKYFATPNDSLGGDYIATSDDGVTWTKRIAALPFAGRWSKVVYGNGIYLTFLITGNVAGSWAATSSDGITWTARQISATADLAQSAHMFLAGGGGWFFASNDTSGTNVKWVQSQDGVSWTTVSQSSSALLYTRNVTPSADGTQVMAWYPGYAPVCLASVTSSGVGQFANAGYPLSYQGVYIGISGLIHDGATFVATGYSAPSTGVSGKWISGSTWTGGIFGSPLLALAYRSGRYVAVCSAGIASSSDGINWVLRQAYSAGSAVLASTSGGFLVVSSDGDFYTSNDGLTWTTRARIASANQIVSGVGNKAIASMAFGLSSGRIVDIGGLLSASFSAAATTTFGAPSIQWQRSTDGGATWANVSGAVTSPYQFTPASGDNGARYRAVFSKASYTTVNSNSATLTVP